MLNSTPVCRCCTMRVGQMFMNTSWLVTFTNQEINHCLLFQMNIASCLLIFNCSDAICWGKRLQVIDSEENDQGLH